MQETSETSWNVGRRMGDASSNDGGTRAMAEYRGLAEQVVDEVRHAAEALMEEQRNRAAETVHGVAEALRHTAETLADENKVLAQYADRAAERIDEFSARFREQRWSDLIAETEAVAHRQPLLFLAGALAMGFVAGRLMSARTEREDIDDPSDRPMRMMASGQQGVP